MNQIQTAQPLFLGNYMKIKKCIINYPRSAIWRDWANSYSNCAKSKNEPGGGSKTQYDNPADNIKYCGYAFFQTCPGDASGSIDCEPEYYYFDIDDRQGPFGEQKIKCLGASPNGCCSCVCSYTVPGLGTPLLMSRSCISSNCSNVEDCDYSYTPPLKGVKLPQNCCCGPAYHYAGGTFMHNGCCILINQLTGGLAKLAYSDNRKFPKNKLILGTRSAFSNIIGPLFYQEDYCCNSEPAAIVKSYELAQSAMTKFVNTKDFTDNFLSTNDGYVGTAQLYVGYQHFGDVSISFEEASNVETACFKVLIENRCSSSNPFEDFIKNKLKINGGFNPKMNIRISYKPQNVPKYVIPDKTTIMNIKIQGQENLEYPLIANYGEESEIKIFKASKSTDLGSITFNDFTNSGAGITASPVYFIKNSLVPIQSAENNKNIHRMHFGILTDLCDISSIKQSFSEDDNYTERDFIILNGQVLYSNIFIKEKHPCPPLEIYNTFLGKRTNCRSDTGIDSGYPPMPTRNDCCVGIEPINSHPYYIPDCGQQKLSEVWTYLKYLSISSFVDFEEKNNKIFMTITISIVDVLKTNFMTPPIVIKKTFDITDDPINKIFSSESEILESFSLDGLGLQDTTLIAGLVQ